MALRINSGYKSLNLYFDQPTNAYDVDDVDTGGTTQVTQTDIRTDLQGLKVWIRSTSWAGANPINSELYYDGPFQGYLAIDKLTQASTDLLADNTTYYIKYAFISKLDITEYTILPLASGNPSEATGTTLDVTSPIVGYLTRDPVEIPTDSDGSNPVYAGATGTFKVYRYGQDISTDAAVTYAVSTATGGVVAAFGTGANKNVYSVTAITDLTGTIKLTATYTDPLNNANTITIEQILNVSKRRPGQTAPLVNLTSTGQVFVLTEDSSGSTKNPGNVKLIATTSNITNPTYTWVLDPGGTNTPVEGTGAGYTGGYLTGTSLNAGKDELTINSSFFAGATPQFKLFEVTVGSSVVGSTISVKDRMSVYYLKEGSDSLAMGLINENQTVTLDKTGSTVSGLPIESEAVVVEGTTQLTAPVVTFAVNSQSGFGGSLSINTAANNPIAGKPAGYIRATQITANQATATITATVAGTALSKVLTVNRVQDGADGTNIDAQLTNDFHTVPTAADGTGGVYTGASTTIEVYKNGVLQTSGFTFYISGLQNVKYRGTGDTSDRTGTGETNGALTTTSGTAIVDIVELSADSGYLDITAKQTSDSQLFTERFSLSRNKAGVIGNDAVIYEIRSNANVIAKASPDAGTDGVHTPSSINFSIYQTVGNNVPALTGGARLYYIQWNSPVPEPTTNDTYAVLVPVTGIIPAVTIANNSDYTSVNIKLLYKNSNNNYTELDREEIGVVFKGAPGYTPIKNTDYFDGIAGITVNLSNDSHVIPSNSDGSSPIFTGSATDIRVYVAGTELTYTTAGTPGNGQFNVSQAVNNVTSPTGVATGSYVNFGDITAMSADAGYREFTINGKTSNGTAFTSTKKQSFAKSKKGTTGDNAKYWAIDRSSPILYKNAPDSATSGSYTSTIITGKYYDGNSGGTNGYLSIRDNDTGSYSSVANPYTLAPSAGTGLTSIGIALYSDSGRSTLVDTAVIPIVFRGAKGQDSTVAGPTGAQVYKVYKAHNSNSSAPAGIAADGSTTTTNGATPSGWSTTPPTLDATNFVQWESDGKQPSGSTTTTWSAPYLSYFKVNSLDAITATIGTFQSASSGERTVISGSKILVYDSSGNIRVKIGDLT